MKLKKGDKVIVKSGILLDCIGTVKYSKGCICYVEIDLFIEIKATVFLNSQLHIYK